MLQYKRFRRDHARIEPSKHSGWTKMPKGIPRKYLHACTKTETSANGAVGIGSESAGYTHTKSVVDAGCVASLMAFDNKT